MRITRSVWARGRGLRMSCRGRQFTGRARSLSVESPTPRRGHGRPVGGRDAPGLFGKNVTERDNGVLCFPATGCEVIQVAIVDDHPVARRGLQSILAEAGDIEVAAAVGDPAEFSAGGTGTGPDVIMLDLYLDGDQPCLDVIAKLRHDHKVLVVSASGRPAAVLGAIRAGACGYVTKLADPPMLIAAAHTVASGGFALSSQLADMLRGELARTPAATEAAAGNPSLSLRE